MNVPKLRFKEFNQDYKSGILRDLIDYIADNRGKNPDYYLSQGIPVIDNFMIQNSRYPNLSLTNRFIDDNLYKNFIRKEIEPDDTLITLVGNGIGNLALVPNEKCVIIQNTLGLRTNLNNDKKYLYYLLLSKNNEIKKLDRGMAQPSIRQDELLSLDIFIPDKKEQLKVSNFLSRLDKKIELQSKKIENLKLFKKGLISKLLNGYDYENMKIKNVLDFEQPTKYIVDSDEYINDDKAIPVLTANKAFILGYCNENNYYDKGDSIIFDDFTMDMKYTNFNYKVKSSAIKILTAKENHDLKFLYELLLSLNLTSEEHKRHYISIVQEMNVKIPSIEIQKNISSKLNLIDNKILLEEKFFNNLIKLKKGLMHNMFV